MKVKELIEKLSGFGQECEIIMSSDSEGNSFTPFSGAFDFGVWDQEENEFWSDSWSAEDACMSKKEWEKTLTTFPSAIVLWP